jgi:OHCU decarboxylase
MAAARPFASVERVHESAEAAAAKLAPEDWLAAFAAHPRIGDRQVRGQAAREQAGAARAPSRLLAQLARVNAGYERRFGFIFIVCASGKTAGEMLALLQRRLKNERPEELRIAAEEQRKITRIRLEKLLSL